MNFGKFLATAVFILACLPLHAHQDRIIKLVAGKLEGLPDKYQPASFNVADRRMELGKLSVAIPDCIWKHWGKIKEKNLSFSASWYHDPEILPPYILVTAHKSAKEYYELLLNLDTLAIISFKKALEDSDGGTNFESIPLEPSCLATWQVTSKP